MRDVEAHFKAKGLDITYYVVQRVLSDPVYLTGRLQATYKGVLYEVRPILLRRPIPQDLYDRAEAQRLGRSGKNSVTPYGYFLLNHILLVHAPCEGQIIDGERTRLSAYLSRNSTRTWEAA